MGNCIYGLIKWFFKSKKKEYNQIFDDVSKNDSFKVFKNDDRHVNKVVFFMNNASDKVFPLIFKEFINVNPEFNEINMEKEGGKYVVKSVCCPKSGITDYRYTYYRINLINYTGVGHVNCLIIDSVREYGLFFDSHVDLKYLPEDLIKYVDIPKYYTVVGPRNLGMGFWKRLQTFDCFCQTYTILVFLAIIRNNTLELSEMGDMLVNTINDQIVGYFLFHLYTKLNEEGFKIGDVGGKFSYPKNKIRKITNSVSILCCSRKSVEEPETQRLIVKEEDGCVLVDF